MSMRDDAVSVIDYDLLWDTVTGDLPELIAVLVQGGANTSVVVILSAGRQHMISGSKEPNLVTGSEGSQFAWAEMLRSAQHDIP
jgi:hypothetical protein